MNFSAENLPKKNNFKKETFSRFRKNISVENFSLIIFFQIILVSNQIFLE